ncbi:MAG: NAD(P)-dependent oxidoreductase [Deferribacterota bacterium]|nr:NAD(P)-dependent oxidoreductase [Deferribacterota bacterium]
MILITGGSGFIGRYFIQSLHNSHEIINLDIKKPDFKSNAYHIKGNIKDLNNFDSLPKYIDTIIHLAAEHKDIGISDKEYFNVNKGGTKNIINFAVKRNVNNIVFFSTAAVYGNYFSGVNEKCPLKCETPYSKSKLEAERSLISWAKKEKKRRLVILRPSVVIGPHNYANMFLLIKQIDKGPFIRIGKGKNIKSLAYVQNIVDFTIYLLNENKENVSIFNYADEPHLTTKEIIDIIAHSLGKKKSLSLPFPIVYSFGIIFDLFSSLFNIKTPINIKRIIKICNETYLKAESIKLTAFKPKYTSIDGLKLMVKWYKNYIS